MDYFTDQLWSAIQAGYDDSGVDYEAPDQLMLDSLQQDVVKFSAAKDDAMNRAIYKELLDAEGRIRSFSQFRNAAFEIANEHVHSWLKAEYNLAITSAQAASKWVRIEADAEDLPLLQFDAIIDNHTTEICRNFNGVTLPINHPFWDEYYIPNHFGERSTIRQLDEGEETDPSTIVYPDRIPAMFKTNLAKMRKAFPPDHPYYHRG